MFRVALRPLVCASLVCVGPAPQSANAQGSLPLELAPASLMPFDAFGAAVCLDGDTAIIGAPAHDGPGGADQGAAYIYRWTDAGWVEEATLLASDGAGFDSFGSSVWLDGETAVVGAPFRLGPGGENQGAAYVFTRSGTVWTQHAILLANDGASFAYFGVAACLDDDTIVVGATGGIGAIFDAGAAYVYTRTAGVWSQQAKIYASDGWIGDNFGAVVSVSGDTVIVGAPYRDDVAGVDQGAAYVFTRSGGSWSEHAKLTASDAAAADLFGISVALEGDRALVGAYLDNGPLGDDQGSVYHYARSAGVWTEQPKLFALEGGGDDYFGAEISIDGDMIAVGAIGDDGKGVDAGVIHVFKLVSGVWVPVQRITPAAINSGDQFGVAVSLDGGRLLGGSQQHNESAGAAFLATMSGAHWVLDPLLIESPDPGVGYDPNFGFAIATDGRTLAIGSPHYDFGPGAVGRVFLFRREADGSWSPDGHIVAPDPALDDRFGASLAVEGDTIIVGAPGRLAPYFATFTPVGRAYIFQRAGGVWSHAQSLAPTAIVLGAQFGIDVAIDGDLAVISAASGETAVLDFDGATWTRRASSGALVGGVSIAVRNGLIVAGIFHYNNFAGQVCVVEYDEFGVLGPATFIDSPLGAAQAGFGADVAVHGDRVVVGAPLAEFPLPDGSAANGGAFVLRRQGPGAWFFDGVLHSLNPGGASDLGGAVAIDESRVILGRNGGSFTPEDWLIFTLAGDQWALSSRFSAEPVLSGNSFFLHEGVAFRRAPTMLIVDNVLNNIGEVHVFTPDLDTSRPVVTEPARHRLDVSLASAAAASTRGSSLFATPAAFASAAGAIDLRGDDLLIRSTTGVPILFGTDMSVGRSVTLAADDGPLDVYGSLTLEPGGRALASGATATVRASGSLEIGVNATFETAPATLLALTGDSRIFPGGTILGGSLVENTGSLTMADAIVATTGAAANSGDVVVQADSIVVGDYMNSGTTTVQNGALTVLGALTNTGAIIGDFTALRATGGFFVEYDYAASPSATLVLLGGVAKFGADADIAINDNARYDMATSELRMVGLAGSVQTLERMSADIGSSPDGLDRTLPGHYPIDTLRIGPTATTVDLVDTHDNDNLGQATCEAVYARTLIIDAGATLNTNGCPVYYETLVLNGSVDDPSNLIQIAHCVADLTGDGQVDGADLGLLLGSWGAAQGDLNADGVTDGADLGLLLGAWGACL